jgi:hypothetical protein
MASGKGTHEACDSTDESSNVISLGGNHYWVEDSQPDPMAGAAIPEPARDDGPFGRNGFHWGTLPSRTGLASTPFRLLTALWKAKDRTATFRDLAKAVWDDGEINLRDDNRLGSARRAINDFMEAGVFPFRVRTSPKNEVVTLIENTGQPTSSPNPAAGKKARRSPRPARQ